MLRGGLDWWTIRINAANYTPIPKVGGAAIALAYVAALMLVLCIPPLAEGITSTGLPLILKFALPAALTGSRCRLKDDLND